MEVCVWGSDKIVARDMAWGQRGAEDKSPQNSREEKELLQLVASSSQESGGTTKWPQLICLSNSNGLCFGGTEV